MLSLRISRCACGCSPDCLASVTLTSSVVPFASIPSISFPHALSSVCEFSELLNFQICAVLRAHRCCAQLALSAIDVQHDSSAPIHHSLSLLMCQSLFSACLNMRPCSLVHAHSTQFLGVLLFQSHSHHFMCSLPPATVLQLVASDFGVCCLLWRACGCLDERWLRVRWTMGSMRGPD